MRATSLLIALACAGCAATRPAATTGAAVPASMPSTMPSTMPAPVPASFQGTWSSADGAAFLGIADHRVVLNLPGLPRGTAAIRAVAVVGATAELTLDDGVVLVLAAGRATDERVVGGVPLAADRPVLTVAVAGPTAPAAARLWSADGATWLPLAAAPRSAAAADPGHRLLAVADAVGEPLLVHAAEDLLRRARRGAVGAALDAVWTEHARLLRLAAVDGLARQVEAPAPDALADVDRLIAALARCQGAYATWRAERD